MTLLKRARQLEEEYDPQMNAEARGAIDDPQMKNVINTLKEIKEQIQQHEAQLPTSRKSGRGDMAVTTVENKGIGGRLVLQNPQ